MKQPGSSMDRRHSSLRSTPSPNTIRGGNQSDDDDNRGRNFEFAEALNRARSN